MINEMWTNIEQIEVRVTTLDDNNNWIDEYESIPITWLKEGDVFKVRNKDGSLLPNTDKGGYLFTALSDAEYDELRKWVIAYE